MATDVIMPQMGESIAEGTITKWLKQVGDEIKRDEPLFEISTDKVDAEIPAPAAGVLLEILVEEGQTVDINTVVARIGAEGEVAATPGPEKPVREAEPAPAVPDTRSAPAPQHAPVQPLPAAPAQDRQANGAVFDGAPGGRHRAGCPGPRRGPDYVAKGRYRLQG